MNETTSSLINISIYALFKLYMIKCDVTLYRSIRAKKKRTNDLLSTIIHVLVLFILINDYFILIYTFNYGKVSFFISISLIQFFFSNSHTY